MNADVGCVAVAVAVAVLAQTWSNTRTCFTPHDCRL